MKKLLVIMVFLSVSLFAQIASDNASNYGGIFSNGNNQGSGFEPWSITHNNSNPPYAGSFTASSTSGAGDINVSGVSFGLYANPSTAYVNADRAFTVPLSVGNSFTFKMALNFDNGNKGFVLFAASMGQVFNFNVGSGGSVSASGGAVLAPGPGLGYNYGGNDAVISVRIDIASSTSFAYRIERVSSQGNQGVLFSGVVSGLTQSINGFRFYNSGTDNGAAQNNLYFNSLLVTSAEVTFTDGSGFTPSVSQNSSNQAIGRFALSGNIENAYLAGASIKLNGSRTGASNFKLWYSADASFSSGSDVQLGSTVAADPGDGNSVTFSSFLSPIIGTSAGYFFITCDVASDATGTIQAVLVNNSSLTLLGGTLLGTITNAALSSAAAPLPVELSSFSAAVAGKSVVLNWRTETEVNNYGFDVERSSDKNSWNTIGFVHGNGNSNSPKQYSFADNSVSGAGKYFYRLKQMDNDGTTEYSKVLEIAFDQPMEYALGQNYPNPFNPTTAITFSVPEAGFVNLSVFDLLGQKVAELVNSTINAGTYTMDYDATNLQSGIYFYTMKAGSFTETRKMMLTK